MEILDGIHRIEAEVGGRPLYLFLFLGERNLLLDAGCSNTVAAFIFPYLDSLGLGPRDLHQLVITHPDADHQGGVHALTSANPELNVGCGALDRELVSDPETIMSRRYGAYRADHGIEYDTETTAWLREMCGEEYPVDTVYAGGETIDLGRGRELRVLHVPGHSAGHIALQDVRTCALFSGDCVQGSVYLGLDGTRKLCPTYTDVAPYLQTIERIAALAPSELHGCHWPTARGSEVAAFLDQSRRYVDTIDELVQGVLAESPSGVSLRELIEQVNARLDEPWDDALAQELVFSLHGHAERRATHAGRNADGHVLYREAERA